GRASPSLVGPGMGMPEPGTPASATSASAVELKATLGMANRKAMAMSAGPPPIGQTVGGAGMDPAVEAAPVALTATPVDSAIAKAAEANAPPMVLVVFVSPVATPVC